MKKAIVLALLMSAVLANAYWPRCFKALPPRVIPDARTIGLGHNGLALTDPAGIGYLNPAALARGPKLEAIWVHSFEGQPETWGTASDFVGASYCLRTGLGFGLSFYHFNLGEYDAFNEQGEYLGRLRAFDLAPTVAIGYQVLPKLSVGGSAAFIYSNQGYYSWFWGSYGPCDAFGFKVDAGLQYRAVDWLNLGFALRNIGPNMVYDSLYSDTLPLTLGFGWEMKPASMGLFEILLVSDIARDLKAESLSDSGDGFQCWWEGLGKGIGLELSYARIVKVRLGYFEDILNEQGGIMVGERYSLRHISLLRFLTQKDVGKFQSWGFCWGVGLEFKGFALDFGVDENIYDHASENLRLQLSYKLR